jgi:carboxypeptidase Taq
MENYIITYKETRKKIKAFEYFVWLASWDMETEAPSGSSDYRTKQYEVIAQEIYQLQSNLDYVQAIEYLYEHLETLNDPDFETEIKRVYKDLRIIKKVPKEEYLEYQVLVSQGSLIWAKAKENNDFESYKPLLEKIVLYNQKLVKYLETEDQKGYNILLDFYEPGFGVEEYDLFFDTLKEKLVPFVLDVTKRKKQRFPKSLTKGNFPILDQKAFSNYLMKIFKYDLNHGLLKESAHPFTSGVSSQDTRITTHYHEDNVLSNIFSVIHEMGHGIYELQNDPKYDDTFLNGGTSLGIHESQSRMYENMIGRSYDFWKTHYPKLVETFPKQLKNVSLETFYQFVNLPKRSLIRIEADELTYSLHVMVRYEIEKLLIAGKLKVSDLPKKWNQLMKKYVGVTPKNDKEGVLQDIHWSFGAIGYFPTYALGSAYAAQIYHQMNQEINIKSIIENNEIEKINQWLKERVHQFGKSKNPKEILMIATKESFNPNYFVDYLIQKYQHLF